MIKATVTEREMLDDLGAGNWWYGDSAKLADVSRVAGVDGGMSMTELLTTNSLGLNRADTVWLAGRREMIGNLTPDLHVNVIARITGVRNPDMTAIADILGTSATGTTPPARSLQTSIERLASTLPDGFSAEMDWQDECLTMATLQAAVSLYEMQRGRLIRAASAAFSVSAFMANRSGADPETEYQWVTDRILTYYGN